MSDRPRTRLFGLATVTLVVIATIYFFRDRPRPHGASDAPSSSEEVANPAFFEAQNATSGSAPSAPAKSEMPELDRAHADSIRQKLRELPPLPRGESNATANTGGNYPVMPDDPDSGAVLGRYIRSRIVDDYVPLAKSCYENALAKSPNLGGHVVMKFRIVGDRRVGGVVDSADVDPATTMHDETFLQCVKESMMAVSFDAPPKDGHVDVVYPLDFSPGDGGDSD